MSYWRCTYACDQHGPCFSGSGQVLYSGACVHLKSVVNLLLVLGRTITNKKSVYARHQRGPSFAGSGQVFKPLHIRRTRVTMVIHLSLVSGVFLIQNVIFVVLLMGELTQEEVGGSQQQGPGYSHPEAPGQLVRGILGDHQLEAEAQGRHQGQERCRQKVRISGLPLFD